MKKAKVQVDEGRRLICCVDAEIDADHYGILVTVPKAFETEELRDWVLDEKDKLVHDPLPAAEPEPSEMEILQGELLNSYLAQTELYERTLALEEENLLTMVAIADVYEMILGGNL